MGWGDFWPAAAGWAITWIPVLGPLGILATALVAYFAYRQKLEADRRAQWWVRAQWALEASLSANPRRSLAGLAVLNDLKTSSLATREDRELFRLIGVTAREELLGGGSGSTVREARPGGASTVESGPTPAATAVLADALREQVEKLAGEAGEPSPFLLGPSGTPTVGEAQKH